ncbi:unnamed protein product [Effrenium voratum]|uniref:Uncharacterized protein n=1 Tax=Effrenium voratum TaxID=2562239 RepID=A0AA36HK12_9DINO|nr:unnamed protein product [Effrenium voratum]
MHACLEDVDRTLDLDVHYTPRATGTKWQGLLGMFQEDRRHLQVPVNEQSTWQSTRKCKRLQAQLTQDAQLVFVSPYFPRRAHLMQECREETGSTLSWMSAAWALCKLDRGCAKC